MTEEAGFPIDAGPLALGSCVLLCPSSLGTVTPSDNNDYDIESQLKTPHHRPRCHPKGQMLWIATPKRARKPTESHGSLDHKIRGSAEGFKLVGR